MTGYTSNQQASSKKARIKALKIDRERYKKRQTDLGIAVLPLTTRRSALEKKRVAATNPLDQAEIDRLTPLINDLNIEIKPYTDAINGLTKDIERVNQKIRALEEGSDFSSPWNGGNPQTASNTISASPELPGEQRSSGGATSGNVQTAQSMPGYSVPKPQPNSLLLNNSGSNPSTTPPVPKKSTSGYDDDFRAAAQVLYPGNSSNELPPLVRRDRQPLTQPERMYPVTGYDEDIYEPWPDDVIETAIKRYPDFRKKKTVARRLENMTSEGSQDNGMYSGPNQRKNRWDFD